MAAPPNPPVRTRFAPSPTGRPHVGNIRNAIYSWLLARRFGGQFILRLEDTDRERYDPESETAIYEALRSLGLNYDEGPDCGGPAGPYVQSQRLEHYHEVVERLIQTGAAYRCWCDRERLARVREERQKREIHPYGYDKHCRSLPEEERARLLTSGAPFVVRLAIPDGGETSFEDVVRGRISYPNRELDDHVLLKTDGFPTYHLACVVDDHLMAITHVIRSEEWLPSTPRHVLLYQAMGWAPPLFVHPALIQGRDPQSGKVAKLSKRHGSVHVGEYLRQGYLPDALVNFLVLLGWSPGGDRELMTRAEMIELFDPASINASPSVFDPDKLLWMNGVYIRALPASELVQLALPYLIEAGLLAPEPTPAELDYAGQALRLEHERLKTLSEIPEATRFFFEEPPQYDEAAVRKRLHREGAVPLLRRCLERMEALSAWSAESLEEAVRATAEEAGAKAGDIIHPVRVAVTGRMVGPSLFDTLAVLGRDRTLGRIRHALERFGGESARAPV